MPNGIVAQTASLLCIPGWMDFIFITLYVIENNTITPSYQAEMADIGTCQ